MGISQFASSSIRSTVSAVLGGIGGLFEGDGRVYRATLGIDLTADVPGNTQLLTPGSRVDVLVKMSTVTGFRTVCIKIPDAYGPARDQDLLLASSADGIPFHHAVLPAANVDSRLYSSLWLYLAGIEPVVFGLRAEEVAQSTDLTAGDRFSFLISSAVGRFRAVGTLVIDGESDDSATTFAGSSTGGGLRALPPALFYRG